MPKLLRFDRQQYAQDYKRVHHSAEQTQYRNFKKALDFQVKQVVDHINRYGIKDIPLSVLITEQPIKAAYLKCYVDVGVSHAIWTYKKIDEIIRGDTKESPSGFFSRYWEKLMKLFFETDGGERITSVTETTRERVMQVISDNQDLPISQQADVIVNTLNSPDFNRDRALMIARTETTTAANRGAIMAAESADYETGKQWIAIEDANTRPTHTDADGQIVGQGELFIVGGFECMFPGDVSLPAKECINCRCCCAIVPLADAQGLPILKRYSA